MTDIVLTARDARILVPGITPKFSRRRAAATLRRLWRAYWDYQARRATAVMLYALDDRTLADIGVDPRRPRPAAQRQPTPAAVPRRSR